MQKHFNSKEKFPFHEFQQKEMRKIIKGILESKASNFKDFLVKTMVDSVHIYSYALAKIFNKCKKTKLSRHSDIRSCYSSFYKR